MNKIKQFLDWKKALVGAVIGLALVVMVGSAFSVYTNGLLLVLMVAMGAVRLRFSDRRVLTGLSILWCMACIFVTAWAPVMMATADDPLAFFRIGVNYILLNCAIVFAIALLVYLVEGRMRLSVGIASVVLAFLGMVNGFVVLYKGNEIGPMDIMAAGTALNVANQYSFQLSENMIRACLVLCLVWFGGFCFSGGQTRGKLWKRGLALVVLAVLCVGIWKGSTDVGKKIWINTGSSHNGTFLNFVSRLHFLFQEEPEGYSPEVIRDLEEQYLTRTPEEPDRKPNILVIMNESFADLSIFGENFQTDQSVTPFLDSLEENTIRGHMLTSAYGGTTANVEFEFLTGNSLANLPRDCVPYQMYMNSRMFSLPWVMRSHGYRTFATHPYLSSGWNRVKAYEELGFEGYTFLEDYPNEDYLREYISDREMYGYILDCLEEKDAQDPLFLFGVTMQNHGGYEYEGDRYTPHIKLTGLEGDYPKAEQYLSVLHESDMALEYFLTQLQDYPEDTVVVFFGDHLPMLEETIYTDLYGGELVTMNETLLRYTVPFFIWANFDIPEETVEYTSTNYLATHVLETAGFELPPYYQYLKDLEQQIPAMNVYGYYSIEKGRFSGYKYLSEEEAKIKNQYEILQYNGIFGGGDRSEGFFGNYIGQDS